MTFLFDIGNVLLNLHFENFHNAILPAGQTELPGEMLALKDPYETGRMSNEEFVSRALELLEHQLTPAEFITAWQNIFSANDPMWEVVKKAEQQGHQLILFSNTNALHADHFLSDFEIFDSFHHHHFSHQAGTIKPHPDFYQSAIDQFGFDPTDTLYFDDLPENIATGKQFGFQSFQYDPRNHDAALSWLKERIDL